MLNKTRNWTYPL